MESFIKLLTNGITFSGWFAVLVVIATGGLAWVRLMGEMQEHYERRIRQKDEDLADFRLENEELKVKVKALSTTAAKLENRTVEQGAILYGKMVYIRRLERLCMANKLALPPRNGPDESE